MMTKIKLGYELATGEEVDIKPSHLIVTGVTQLSGKTTTLEALISRSKLKAIAFKTKIGEKSFIQGTEIPPYFKDRSDYEFVKSLIEAYSKEKLFLEKGTLMRLSKGSSSLLDIKKKVDDEIAGGKLKGLNQEIYTRLQHYLENLIPQIQYANLSKTLVVYEGINIMNLERFSEEAQSLIIESTLSEVLNTMHDVIIIIPEAWKFIPQKYNNPCKRGVESFIRQGAANGNFIWIDSQDMAGVDKIPLKQISTWILGYQSERNEVKHTLDQIPLPKKQKPKEDHIMQLQKGQFYLASSDRVVAVYVQPSWLDSSTAKNIALGKEEIEKVNAPKVLTPFSIAPKRNDSGSVELRFDDSKIRNELNQLRIDFFNKIQELQTFNQKLAEKLYTFEGRETTIDEDELINKVLQKLPIASNQVQTNEENIIARVLSRIPKTGMVTYEIAPLEKIKKDFQEEVKQKILADIGTLTQDEKKALKYMETKDSDVSPSELITKCFILKVGGSQSVKISNMLKSLTTIDVIERTAGGRYRKGLRKRLETLMANHNSTPQEIDMVYNHILMEVLK